MLNFLADKCLWPLVILAAWVSPHSKLLLQATNSHANHWEYLYMLFYVYSDAIFCDQRIASTAINFCIALMKTEVVVTTRSVFVFYNLLLLNSSFFNLLAIILICKKLQKYYHSLGQLCHHRCLRESCNMHNC